MLNNHENMLNMSPAVPLDYGIQKTSTLTKYIIIKKCSDKIQTNSASSQNLSRHFVGTEKYTEMFNDYCCLDF